jgi:hypothetical protein
VVGAVFFFGWPGGQRQASPSESPPATAASPAPEPAAPAAVPGRRFRARTQESLATTATVEVVVVTLKNGRTIEGRLVREDPSEVVVQTGGGSIGVARQYVAAVEKSERRAPIPPPAVRVPPLASWVKALSQRHASQQARQVPATVVTAGPLRHVPYVSHRAGRYELNVYGDPERPACVEAGVAPGAPVRKEDMEECRALLASGLSDQEDARLVASMPLGEETTRQRGGLAFEVSLPDAPDSHGYWWICLYSAEALDEARLHEAQLADLVVHESALSSVEGNDPHSWSRADVRSAGPRRLGGQATDGGSGTVYVRGYTRRDGTYVQPHTRSAPGTGGGRRGGGRR